MMHADTFHQIYQAWENSAEAQPNCDITTYAGRSRLFQIYVNARRVELDNQLQQPGVIPAQQAYFDQGADRYQRLRDKIEMAYFEKNKAQSIMVRAKKIMSEKKYEEVQTALNALFQEENYQRWLQVRYQCGLELARRKALQDYIAMYEAEFASKQPKQSQNSMFPRFEQVIQNSLYDSKSYAQGWIGYTSAAFLFSVAHGVASMIKTSRQNAQKHAQALKVYQEILGMNDAVENDALSYILLELRHKHGASLSVEEKATLDAMIELRAQRHEGGLINNRAGLDAYRQNNPTYTAWVARKLEERHLGCQEKPLESALSFYKDLYYTNLYSKCVQQNFQGNDIDLLNDAERNLFLHQDEQDQGAPLDQLFFSNPLARLSRYVETAGHESEFLDESVAVLQTAPGKRGTQSFTGLQNHDNLTNTALADQNTSMLRAVANEVMGLLSTAALESGQQFASLQYKYLAGDNAQAPASQDGMSDEVKAHLAGRRAPRPGAQN